MIILSTASTSTRVLAASLTIELENAAAVTFVGAVARWNADGSPRRPVNPKARVDAPEVDGVAKQQTVGKWVIPNAPPGRYDLVILAGERVRIDGFDFPPVLEFDEFFAAKDKPSEEAREFITKDVAKSPHFENKVSTLCFAGDPKQVRVLVQLLRDEPTSYDGEFGEQVAVLRHDVWQYTYRYGAWTKEKRTRVFDRSLAPKRMLRQWTWIWEPALGGIQVKDEPIVVNYCIPKTHDPERARGLWPY
jgi:hypothetical protein